MNKESLEKSIDSLIEAMLLEKSEDVMDALVGKPVHDDEQNPQDPKAAKTTADAALPPETATEHEGRGGRPAEVHEIREEQGDSNEEDVGQGKKTKEAKGYDAVQSEAKEVHPETTVSHNPAGDHADMNKGVLISKEDYAFLVKAKEMVKARQLKKSQEKQESLVKSMIAKETEGLVRVNSALAKKLEETTNLLKSLGSRPRQSKSITSASALEKSFSDARTQDEQTEFTKAQKLDAAESLMKSGEISMNDVIELENTGFIYDPRKRAAVERKLVTGK